MFQQLHHERDRRRGSIHVYSIKSNTPSTTIIIIMITIIIIIIIIIIINVTAKARLDA